MEFNNYDSYLKKTIKSLSKTEKQIQKLILEIENIQINNFKEENKESQLLSIKSESTLDVLKRFNTMIIKTILTIDKINNIIVK